MVHVLGTLLLLHLSTLGFAATVVVPRVAATTCAFRVIQPSRENVLNEYADYEQYAIAAPDFSKIYLPSDGDVLVKSRVPGFDGRPPLNVELKWFERVMEKEAKYLQDVTISIATSPSGGEVAGWKKYDEGRHEFKRFIENHLEGDYVQAFHLWPTPSGRTLYQQPDIYRFAPEVFALESNDPPGPRFFQVVDIKFVSPRELIVIYGTQKPNEFFLLAVDLKQPAATRVRWKARTVFYPRVRFHRDAEVVEMQVIDRANSQTHVFILDWNTGKGLRSHGFWPGIQTVVKDAGSLYLADANGNLIEYAFRPGKEDKVIHLEGFASEKEAPVIMVRPGKPHHLLIAGKKRVAILDVAERKEIFAMEGNFNNDAPTNYGHGFFNADGSMLFLPMGQILAAVDIEKQALVALDSFPAIDWLIPSATDPRQLLVQCFDRPGAGAWLVTIP